MKVNKTEFKNYGLGLMTTRERKHLMDMGAIAQKVGGDVIVAEYPKVLIRKSDGEETTIDMGGDLFQLRQERDKIQKDGKNARIVYFPRKYSEYRQKQHAKDMAEIKEKEARDELALQENN